MSQKSKKYYDFTYESLPRWSSYWYQIHEVLSKKPKKVLEIGVGNKVVSNYLKESGLRIDTLDIDKDLEPDIVASATKIPLPDNSYDVVLAAEILEHLPFSDFSKALSEIYRVSSDCAVISLPHWGRVVAAMLKIPILPWLRFLWKIPGIKKHEEKDISGHYWEIGKRGYPERLIKNKIKKSGFKIKKDYVIMEYPYHHFFILNR